MKTKTIFFLVTLMLAIFIVVWFGMGKLTGKRPTKKRIPHANLTKMANVNEVNDLNFRVCAGTDCDRAGVLQKGSELILTGKKDSVITTNGSYFQWVEVKTIGNYCLVINSDEKLGCRIWQTEPQVQGWVNSVFLNVNGN